MTMLSHYTGERGLIGICRSQCLRATNFLYLNDKTEFLYGWSALNEGAYELLRPRIPDDLIDPTKSFTDILAGMVSQLKDYAQTNDGYGDLYVTSFARGRTKDEDDRGVLTLWERYTGSVGFCLQFDESDVESFIQKEMLRSSYAHLKLVEVKYGIDKSNRKYNEICDQLSFRMQKELYLRSKDNRIEPAWQMEKADTYLFRLLMEFCGEYKDPSFIDEREIRILAYPSRESFSRPLIGLATRKPIYHPTHPDLIKKFITLGEDWFPGLMPRRILIGPKANLSNHTFFSLYPDPPMFMESKIPIR